MTETATSLRTQALIAAAAVLAGAAAGVLVQAAIEVGRGRRDDREQLLAAAELLDAMEQRERHSYNVALERDHDVRRLERSNYELRDRALDAERRRDLAEKRAQLAYHAQGRLDVIRKALDSAARSEFAQDNLALTLAVVERELREGDREPEVNPEQLPAPVELLKWEPNMAPCLCGADAEGEVAGPCHEDNCPRWEPEG